MSFWKKALSVAKDVGTAVASEVEKQANETRELKNKYEGMSDDDLFNVLKSDGFLGKSQKEKGAAFGILRRRGYSVEDINKRAM
ncbi:hypothetical protein [Pseudoalteromonas rubra]|uniref:hypothetical protein n=1 Tax=Pseudoalteromonas rubra TaxID=43658 RepID=UPI002DBAABEE|nr:hypothetical protein [Pseudoalteromonas rubra]MEC4090924.1 hypothetical protein [Pseudoalteromonas rubra]